MSDEDSMPDETDNDQLTEKALPIQGISLDGATIRLMLQPTGVVGISPETFKGVRYLAVGFDAARPDEIDSNQGSPGLMEFKDALLREMDTRLTALLNL